ncbi:hypothetical protein OH77DRAFT_645575 [Trametes cingulata]|nr:hypothetical protein OH77DRAFT_645575 [Trametes cingulata]
MRSYAPSLRLSALFVYVADFSIPSRVFPICPRRCFAAPSTQCARSWMWCEFAGTSCCPRSGDMWCVVRQSSLSDEEAALLVGTRTRLRACAKLANLTLAVSDRVLEPCVERYSGTSASVWLC